MSTSDDGASTPSAAFRCGYVALVGRPNAGKSTLLNQILGSKLAITSAKPQTTRHRIAGIHTDEQAQLVLIDTPGIHEAWTELNKAMVKHATDALNEADAVCWVVDMTVLARRVNKGEPVLDAGEEQVAAAVEACGRPVIIVANKIDVISVQLLLPVIDALRERLAFHAAMPTSALNGEGVPELLAELRLLMPVQAALFPLDEWAQVSERFLAAEVIREKIFHLTEQEVPYASTVEITKFDEEERETNNMVKIYADIIVERPSQKGIIIGKRGEMLKRIGTLARKELQTLLESRVYLELFVKVEPEWTRTKGGLRKVGFQGS